MEDTAEDTAVGEDGEDGEEDIGVDEDMAVGVDEVTAVGVAAGDIGVDVSPVFRPRDTLSL